MSKERPILFSGPMVRALRDGSKTQTRRVMKPQLVYGTVAGLFNSWYLPRAEGGGTLYPNGKEKILGSCPYGQPGDRFAVRETFYAWGHWTKRYSEKKHREEWHFVDETTGTGKAYRYEADEKLPRRKRELHEVGWWKRPAIFMPRAASRITLEITSVRVERLQDISDADCVAESCGALPAAIGCPTTSAPGETIPRAMFRALWESINGPDSWDANPWVWAIEFRRLP